MVAMSQEKIIHAMLNCTSFQHVTIQQWWQYKETVLNRLCGAVALFWLKFVWVRILARNGLLDILSDCIDVIWHKLILFSW
jgi:hypothetical protein